MKLRDAAFLADENIHPDVIAALRSMGIDTETVAQAALAGKGDILIMRHALSEKRIILTHDSDFGYLAIAAGERTHGIVYLRPGHVDSNFTLETLKPVLAREVETDSAFLMVAERKGSTVRLRIRDLR